MKANYANYSKLEKYLDDNDIEYHKFDAHHYRILGNVAMVDVWPARMTVHVVTTEAIDPNKYFRLDYWFNEKQLEAVLNGKDWRKVRSGNGK